MNITQAKAAMERLLGKKKAGWRYDETAPRAEEREQVRDTVAPLRAAAEQAKAALQARRSELLQDPEYRRLLGVWAKADDAATVALSKLHHFRVKIFRVNGMFNEVVAEGDNGQEAIDALKAKVRS